MNLETEGKINLLVTFIQRFVTQSKLSLIFTKTLYFHIKQPIFRITHMTHSRMQMTQSFITKLNHWKLIFRKQPIIAVDEIKVNVILTTKYNVKSKNFIIAIFYFPVSFLLYTVCRNTSTFISFFLQDFFKASTEQVTINKWYIQLDIIASRRCSAASNSKETSGGKMQLNLSRNWTKPVTLIILNKAEASHPSKLHLGI